MLNIPRLLAGLAKKRPVFHSEADFQHAFAWHLGEVLAGAQIRLEVRPTKDSNASIDVLVRHDGGETALELKYLCQRLEYRSGDESFVLRPQSAQDIRRYDVLKDLVRMEQFRATRAGAWASVIAITNDPSYWKPPRRLDTVDAAFRLHDGRVLEGRMTWGAATGKGTMQNRQEPIMLRGSYTIQWRPFSSVDGQFGEFRFLHIAAAG